MKFCLWKIIWATWKILRSDLFFLWIKKHLHVFLVRLCSQKFTFILRIQTFIIWTFNFQSCCWSTKYFFDWSMSFDLWKSQCCQQREIGGRFMFLFGPTRFFFLISLVFYSLFHSFLWIQRRWRKISQPPIIQCCHHFALLWWGWEKQRRSSCSPGGWKSHGRAHFHTAVIDDFVLLLCAHCVF